MAAISADVRTGDLTARAATLVALALAVGLFAAAPGGRAAEHTGNQQALASAINGEHRSPEYVERDRYRHPEETLAFFGIRPDMTVVEVFPGGGWYAEILAPYLHDQGHLIEANFPASSDNAFMRKMANKFQAKLKAEPAIYGRVELQPFAPPDYITLGPPGTVDMILTFRNMHDLVYANPHGEVTDAVVARFFRAAYSTLKPGGTLGVVAHRADPDAAVSESSKQGRLPQAYVVREAERAGLRLVDESPVNANAADPRDIPVWYLPPSLSGPEEDRSKYADIGESDRMTLKFAKPKE